MLAEYVTIGTPRQGSRFVGSKTYRTYSKKRWISISCSDRSNDYWNYNYFLVERPRQHLNFLKDI